MCTGHYKVGYAGVLPAANVVQLNDVMTMLLTTAATAADVKPPLMIWCCTELV